MSGERSIGVAAAGRFGAFCLEAFADLRGAGVVAISDVDRAREVTAIDGLWLPATVEIVILATL